MSPKEKAKELYEKYDTLFKVPYKKHYQIKQCALIAVNEIIILTEKDFDYSPESEEVVFWQAVKQELEKL